MAWSSCCSAEVSIIDDMGICHDCKEWCEVVSEDPKEEEEEERCIKSKKKP